MGENLQGRRLQMVKEILIETRKSGANNMRNFKRDEEEKNPSGIRQVLSRGTDGQETERRERHLVNCWETDTSREKDHVRTTCKVTDYGIYLEENSLLEVLEIFNLCFKEAISTEVMYSLNIRGKIIWRDHRAATNTNT